MTLYKLIILSLFFISCKKNTNAYLSIDYKCLDTRTITSIVQGCGSGCAISYSEEKINISKSIIQVEFKGEMYIYEDVEDKFEGSFFIKCDDKNEAILVYFEGDIQENLLDIHVNSISDSFRGYADELCTCLKSN